MRIFNRFPEALGEIKRELKEMGIKVKTHSYQDKDVKDNPDFETYELQNYIYTVTDPRLVDLSPTMPWAEMEFAERISGLPINPGKAWKTRREVWEQFLEDGEGSVFSYTYAERINTNLRLETLINNMRNDPGARQHYLAVWEADDLRNAGGKHRIPCTLGYLFQIRSGQVHMTYLQRSADFATHLMNDIYLAFKLQKFVASRLLIPSGNYTHWFGSLHVFNKDVQGVF